MGGNLFPVKAWAFAAALRNLKGDIEQHNSKCNAISMPRNDGMTRMVLCSPEVTQEVRKQFSMKYCRVRFAIPDAVPSWGCPPLPCLEVYTEQGELAVGPIQASDLDAPLSNAVQVELMHFLLKQRGIDIPLL